MKNKIVDILQKTKSVKRLNEDAPFFVYDQSLLAVNTKQIFAFLDKLQLRSEKSHFYFSYKSCPNIALSKEVLKKFNGIDVSSTNEYLEVKKMGIAPECISISGPAKTTRFLKMLIEDNVSIIHFDSKDEINDYLSLLSKSDFKPTTKYTCRLNVDKNSSKLGMQSEEILDVLKEKRISISGIHAYLGREQFSQSKLQEIIGQIEILADHYKEIKEVYIGPGLNSDLLQADVVPLKGFANKVTWHFEMGRALVDNAGFYFARILSVKNENAIELIINGGIQHYLSAFTDLRKINAFTSFIVDDHGQISEGQREAKVYGSLCLPNDLFAWIDNCPAEVKRGWWACFSPCGAYNVSASLNGFINQDNAQIYLFDNDHGLKLI